MFYRLMGREDLAAAYSRNQGVQIGLVIAGVGTGLAGAVVIYNAGQSHNQGTAEIGLGVMAGGAVLFFIARGLTVDPISEAEARA